MTPWANRSRRSLQKINGSDLIFFTIGLIFWSQKTSDSIEKPMIEFPTLSLLCASGNDFIYFLKSWNWRQNIKKYIFFDQVKKNFAHFWGLKSWSTNFNFEFLFCYCSLKWKEVICKIKNYSIYIIEIFHLVTSQYSICKLYSPLNIYSSTFLTNHEQFFKILVFFL